MLAARDCSATGVMAATTSTGMNLPSIMHYLQTEFSRYERDRNFWELERAEMKARIAKVSSQSAVHTLRSLTMVAGG